MWRINETHGERLKALPETLTPEEARLEARWVSELVSTCDAIHWALSEENVVEKLEPIVDAIESGEGVYEDIFDPVIKFRSSWYVMFSELRPMAVDWAERFREGAEADNSDGVFKVWGQGAGSEVESPDRDFSCNPP